MQILDYAKISRDIYGKNSYYKPMLEILASQLPTRKVPNQIVKVGKLDRSIESQNGFFAALYIKFSSGRARAAAIAFRGTVPSDISNDLEDVYSWFSSAVGTNWFDHAPTYVAKAAVFARHARDYLKQHFPEILHTNIAYTGHSLGGAIAQIMALRGRPYKAIVFNSPGCKEIAGSEMENRKNIITSVNSRYGVINKIGHLVLGNLTVVDVPNLEADAKNLLTHFHQGDFNKATEFARLADTEAGVPPLFIDAAAMSLYYRIESVVDSVGSIEHSLIDVVKAQHSMVNMVNAMQDKHNIQVVDVAGVAA